MDTTTFAPSMELTEATTSIWENTEAKAQRRLIYYVCHGIVGLFVVLFNGFLILAYAKKDKIRNHISMVMMNLIVFCFIHGWIVGIIFPLQRVYRYSMGDVLCIITTLLMDFADNYVLVLLAALAIERLVHLKYPKASLRKVKVWSVVAMVSALIITMCYTWLPLIPDLEIPMAEQVKHDNRERQRYITKFYKHYTCNYQINKKNLLEPIFTLFVGCLCVATVIGVYIAMFCMLRSRLSEYANLTTDRKRQLRKAAVSVLLVAVTFVFTLLPFGVIVQVQAYCDKDTTNKSSSICNGLTLELRFIFSIVAHMGNFLGPLVFILLNTSLRNQLKDFIKGIGQSASPTDSKANVLDETTLGSMPAGVSNFSYYESKEGGF